LRGNCATAGVVPCAICKPDEDFTVKDAGGVELRFTA
jgi:hypothetical protein